MENGYLELLRESLTLLNASAEWVKHSYEQCASIGAKKTYTSEEFDKFENITSRFARTTDMLINKTLRCLDRFELIDGGTVIDIINRAEKRGLVTSSDTLRALKDLRNSIAHEYQTENIVRFFGSVLWSTPFLLEVIANINTYLK
jgi:uncharacterized protein YutE (UPF0331/DUF86 family)